MASALCPHIGFFHAANFYMVTDDYDLSSRISFVCLQVASSAGNGAGRAGARAG